MMKSWLPHLFYVFLLSGSALLLWRTIHSDNQLLAFLHHPGDETYMLISQNNRSVKRDMERQLSAYKNASNSNAERRIQQADFLVKETLSGEMSMTGLRTCFDTLVGGEAWIIYPMAQLLPSRKTQTLSPAAFLTMAQNDSIRQQIAFYTLLNYFASRVGCYDIQCDDFAPVFSPTTLCGSSRQLFRVDVLLSDYYRWPDSTQISFNGERLAVKDGEAYFRRTFDTPGDYPLNIEAATPIYSWSGDTVINTKKMFTLHVTR